jgi:hypothetical protein
MAQQRIISRCGAGILGQVFRVCIYVVFCTLFFTRDLVFLVDKLTLRFIIWVVSHAVSVIISGFVYHNIREYFSVVDDGFVLRHTQLFVYIRTAIFQLHARWLSPLPVTGLTAFSSEGSFMCHICCDTGPRFIRSYPKDRYPCPTVGFEPAM